jgi:hypothetical protein
MSPGTCFKTIAELMVLLLLIPASHTFSQEQADTAAITKTAREAYTLARKNPDIAIIMSYQAMTASRKLNYTKGMADASLALGMAYLAKYNPGDSALYYNSRALELYEASGNINGKGRACYGLSYVYSFRSDHTSSEHYINLALKYFEESNDHRGMVTA